MQDDRHHCWGHSGDGSLSEAADQGGANPASFAAALGSACPRWPRANRRRMHRPGLVRRRPLWGVLASTLRRGSPRGRTGRQKPEGRMRRPRRPASRGRRPGSHSQHTSGSRSSPRRRQILSLVPRRPSSTGVRPLAGVRALVGAHDTLGQMTQPPILRPRPRATRPPLRAKPRTLKHPQTRNPRGRTRSVRRLASRRAPRRPRGRGAAGR